MDDKKGPKVKIVSRAENHSSANTFVRQSNGLSVAIGIAILILAVIIMFFPNSAGGHGL